MACSAATSCSFCCGAIRPKTLVRSTASRISASFIRASSGPEIRPPSSRAPSCCTSAETVSGLSPLMIFGLISSSSIILNALPTSGRSSSAMVISATARICGSPSSGSGMAGASANATPRSPRPAARLYSSSSRPPSGQAESTRSGSPSTNTRCSPASASRSAL